MLPPQKNQGRDSLPSEGANAAASVLCSIVVSNTETVAAISTALGPGAISIVRLSGPLAIACTEPLFRTHSGSLEDQPSHLLRYGWITTSDKEERIDEVLVVVMRAPRSFTGEDIVEIQTNGGALVRTIFRKGGSVGAGVGIVVDFIGSENEELVPIRKCDSVGEIAMIAAKFRIPLPIGPEVGPAPLFV